MSKVYDCAVVGGGASGMMAAGLLGQNGLSVLLLEKNKKLGEKLSITGGGRCNITNAEFDTRALLENYGDAKKFLFSAFSQFSVKDTFEFFEGLGLPLVVEARKRAFPKTQKATDVVKTLENFVKRNGVEIVLNTKIKSLEKKDDIFVLSDGKKEFKAKTVVFAVGGPSGKKLSKDLPASWKILQKLGHTVSPPSPNLIPLKTPARFVRHLSGLSFSFVKLSFKVEGKAKIKKLGKLLFTHFGVSGPTVINASKEALDLLEKYGRLHLCVDFFPDTEFDKLDRRIVNLLNKHPKKKLRNVLSELLPEALIKTIIYEIDKDLLDIKAGELSRENRRDIVHKIKDFCFKISGPADNKEAIVADGGVDLKEVDFKTMQSKIVLGLFLTGDVLNINRPSGGFSLQLCWTSAFVAHRGVLYYLQHLRT